MYKYLSLFTMCSLHCVSMLVYIVILISLHVCLCQCVVNERVILCSSSLQERDLGDEYGWKQVHGDVFRTPSAPILFSSLIGTGYQLAVVGMGCIIVALLGDLYTQ